MFRYALLLVSVCLSTTAYGAELRQTGNSRWLVVASTNDLDNAIGIANAYTGRFSDVQVVEASNGWLAVIAGPFPISGGLKSTLKSLVAGGGLPADAFMSNGERFTRSVWTPKGPGSVPLWKFKSGQPLHIELDGYEIAVSESPSSSDLQVPEISIAKSGRVVLQAQLSEAELDPSSINAEVRSVILDRNAQTPQIVFSSFSMGAHCCTVTKFIVPKGDGMIAIDGRTLDGGGYSFEDVDGDGTFELVSADNSFHYAFAPYANSWAPIIIEKFSDGSIVDMRGQPEFRQYYRRELFRWEHHALISPELWKENGFLAGWVALKSLVGERDDAWQRMLRNYDRESDWPLTECTVPEVNGECPPGKERTLSFPDALRGFLERTGYIGNPEPLPKTANSPPPAARDEVEKTVPAERSIKSGTGFVVSPLGHLVTNYHVIDSCQAYEVKRPGQPPTEAVLVASDSANDLALLQLSTTSGAVAPVRLDVRLGEQVAVFGYPLTRVLSSGGNFTLGNVTALTGIGDDSRYLQISAPVQQGNSGGPLVDKYGNVVGVVTAKLNALASLAATGDIPQNVNFAIRSSSLYAFLVSHGVQPETALSSDVLDAPDLAERAAQFSAAVVCQ